MSLAQRLGDWLSNVFIWPGAVGDDRHRRLYMSALVVAFTPLGLWMAWDDFQAGRYQEVAYIAVLVVPLVSSLIVIRFAEDIRWGYRLVAAPVVVGTGVLLAMGAGEGYGFIWFFFFPTGMCYTLGSREGFVWFLLSLAVYAAILGFDIGVAYPEAMTVRFFVSYGVLGLLALALQRSRDRLLGELAQEKSQLEEALADVQTLSAMIPMCAWCGKFRDDEGYWSKVEEYLASAAGSTVSHGLCPDCLAKVADGVDGDTG